MRSLEEPCENLRTLASWKWHPGTQEIGNPELLLRFVLTHTPRSGRTLRAALFQLDPPAGKIPLHIDPRLCSMNPPERIITHHGTICCCRDETEAGGLKVCLPFTRPPELSANDRIRHEKSPGFGQPQPHQTVDCQHTNTNQEHLSARKRKKRKTERNDVLVILGKRFESEGFRTSVPYSLNDPAITKCLSHSLPGRNYAKSEARRCSS